MIRHELLGRDLGWKLLSLFLGILVWYFVHAGLEGRFAPLTRTATLTLVRPVTILTSARTVGSFRAEPAEVSVTVSGRKDILAQLPEAEIRAFVDLSDVIAATELQRPVELTLPGVLTPVGVYPPSVRVRHRVADGAPAAPASR